MFMGILEGIKQRIAERVEVSRQRQAEEREIKKELREIESKEELKQRKRLAREKVKQKYTAKIKQMKTTRTDPMSGNVNLFGGSNPFYDEPILGVSKKASSPKKTRKRKK